MSEEAQQNWNSVGVHYKLAAIWQARGQSDRAIAGYAEATRLRPDFVPAHLALGQLLEQQGRWEEAAAAYRWAGECNRAEPRFAQKLAELAARHPRAEAEPSPAVSPAGVPAPSAGARGPHIVLYTDCSGIGGAEQCNHALALEFGRQGYRVTVVQDQAHHQLIAEQARCGIRHVWRAEDDLYNRTRPALALVDETEPDRILRTLRPDLVLFADGAPMSNLAAKRVAARLDLPYLVVVHCVAAPWAEQYAPYLEQLPAIYGRAAAVIAVSHANLRLLHARFGLAADGGQVIYNGRPARFFAAPTPAVRDAIRRELALPAGALLVCTVAAMEVRKGYQFLLRAIKRLQDSALWPQLYFAWVGTGSLEPQLRALTEGCGAGAHVRFLGERADVADILTAADLFVLPSQYEGMPLSVMEAMARGTPVAATAVSGIPEELGDAGVLLPDPSVDPDGLVWALSATIRAWSADPEQRQAVGRAGRRRAAALFTEDRMLAEYRTLIARLGGSVGTHG